MRLAVFLRLATRIDNVAGMLGFRTVRGRGYRLLTPIRFFEVTDPRGFSVYDRIWRAIRLGILSPRLRLGFRRPIAHG